MKKGMKKKVVICDVKEVEGEDRTLEFTSSDETNDRVNEIMTLDGWHLENYKNNPVFLWCHNSHEPPIGKSIETYVDKKDKKGLIQKIQFATREIYAFADTIYKLYVAKYMRAVSVGFDLKELKYDADEDQIYLTKKELLETSAVPVPCNPNALQNDGIKSLIQKDIINMQEAGEFMIKLKQYKKENDQQSPSIEDMIQSDKFKEMLDSAVKKVMEKNKVPIQEAKKTVDASAEKFKNDLTKVKIYGNLLSRSLPDQPAKGNKDILDIKSMTEDLKSVL